MNDKVGNTHEDDKKSLLCPVSGGLCYPAMQEAAKIIATYRAKQRQKEADRADDMVFTIAFNSLVTAMVVFCLLLLLFPIGGQAFVIAAVVAGLPTILYKIERWASHE